MSRYINVFGTCLDPQEFMGIVQQFMQREGFAYTSYKNGEQVWKKGNGLMTAPQFIKVTQQGNQIAVEAFLKWALLPCVYAGEMGLSGVMAAPVKAVLRGRVTQLEQLLQQASYNKQMQFQPQPQPTAQ